jgi:hypothetical protein
MHFIFQIHHKTTVMCTSDKVNTWADRVSSVRNCDTGISNETAHNLYNVALSIFAMNIIRSSTAFNQLFQVEKLRN